MPFTEVLRAAIAHRGPIPFRDFMERALYHPVHGYYAGGRAVIGRKGDFFTSVSVGPLFGQMLADQFEEMWQRLGAPKPFTIVEQGAHHGDFAHDVLSAVQVAAPGCDARLDYVIVEPSPRSRAAQEETLGSLRHRVRWVGSLAELAPFTGVHFSNELLDAFPVHLVKWSGTAWVERHVSWENDRFVFVDAALSSPALREHLARLPEVPAGYITEVNLAAAEWVGQLAAKLQRGYVLTIDYGYSREEYYRPDRSAGTLSAYAAHHRELDPLTRPGELDLTAHVDFTTVSEAAREAGLKITGFTDQHHFLVGLSKLHFGDTVPAAQTLRQFKTLMHPELMGQAFHALCFSRGIGEDDVPLAGFQFSRSAPLF